MPLRQNRGAGRDAQPGDDAENDFARCLHMNVLLGGLVYHGAIQADANHGKMS